MPIISKRGLKLGMIALTVGKKRARRLTVDATPVLPDATAAETVISPSFVSIDVDYSSTSNDKDMVDKHPSKYRNNKSDEVDAWRAIEVELITTRMDVDVPYALKCSVCGDHTSQPIRCLDCGSFALYCGACEDAIHTKVFHKPDIWKDGVFQPCCDKVKLLRRSDHKCISETSRSLQLVDHQGRLHEALAVFCACESHPSTLLRYGFWAASPVEPSVGFSVNLLSLLHFLTLECAVSVKGFMQMLRWKNDWTELQFKQLYQIMIGECISSYRNFLRNYEKEHRRHTSPVDDILKCPACPKDCGVTTIAIDGNFGLVRKHHSGISPRGPTNLDDFFLADKGVETFVASYQNDTQSDKECSTFKAGDAIRSQARNAKLDIRGVFGSVCRHEFPVMFMDMKHAEQLAYPVCLIEQLKKKLGNTHLQVVYDIACVLTRHLRKTEQTELLNSITLGLPIFHAYGHGASCQVQYSIRSLEGFGLTDGEGTERLWSYLRPLSKMTKEMTPTHRKELLNDALSHFCRRKIAGLANWLEMRAVRAADVQKDAGNNLKELTDVLKVTQVQVKTWAVEQKQEFLRVKQSNKSSSSWKSSYVLKLQSSNSIRAQMQSCRDNEQQVEFCQKLNELESLLSKTEVKHKISRWTSDQPDYVEVVHSIAVASREKILRQLHHDSSSRAFLVQLLSKYCDGQMIAIRLSKQVHKATTAIKKGVLLFNGITGMKSSSHLPIIICEKDALAPSSPVFASVLDNSQDVSGSVPAAQRWKAIEHLLLFERAAEELLRVADDMKSTLQHYCVVHRTFTQALCSVARTTERAYLTRKILQMEVIMTSIWKVTCKFVDDVQPMPSFIGGQMDASVDISAPDFYIAGGDYIVDSDQECDSEED